VSVFGGKAPSPLRSAGALSMNPGSAGILPACFSQFMVPMHDLRAWGLSMMLAH
jgi:hypothetical protein